MPNDKQKKIEELQQLAYAAYEIAKQYAPYVDITYNTKNADMDSLKQDYKDKTKVALIGATAEVALGFISGLTGGLLSKGLSSIASKAGRQALTKGLKETFKKGAIKGLVKSVKDSAKTSGVKEFGKQVTKQIFDDQVKKTLKSPAMKSLGEVAKVGAINVAGIIAINNMDIDDQYRDYMANFLSDMNKELAKNIVSNTVSKYKNVVNATIKTNSIALRTAQTQTLTNIAMTFASTNDLVSPDSKEVILGQDLLDFLKIDEQKFPLYREVSTKMLTAKDVNFTWKLIRTFQQANDNIVSTKDLYKNTNIKPFGKILTDSASSTLGSYYDTIKSSASTNLKRLQGTELQKVLNDGMEIIADVEDNEDDTSPFITKTDGEPKLFEGWIKQSNVLAGVTSGDVPYIIKHIPTLEERFIELDANRRILPNVTVKKDALNVKFDITNIRRISMQYYRYYGEALKTNAFIRLDEDKLDEYRFMIYCFNGVSYDFEDYLIFKMSNGWTVEMEQAMYLIFDIFSINGQLCMINYKGYLPEPEKYNLELRGKLFKSLKDSVEQYKKEHSSNELGDIDLVINNLDDIIEVNNINSTKEIGEKIDTNGLDSYLNGLPSTYDEDISMFQSDNDNKLLGLLDYGERGINSYLVDTLKQKTPYNTMMITLKRLIQLKYQLNDINDDYLKKLTTSKATIPIKYPDKNGLVEDTFDVNFEKLIGKPTLYNDNLDKFATSLKNSFIELLNYYISIVSAFALYIVNMYGKLETYTINFDIKNMYNEFNEKVENFPIVKLLWQQLYFGSNETILYLSTIFKIKTRKNINIEDLSDTIINSLNPSDDMRAFLRKQLSLSLILNNNDIGLLNLDLNEKEVSTIELIQGLNSLFITLGKYGKTVELIGTILKDYSTYTINGSKSNSMIKNLERFYNQSWKYQCTGRKYIIDGCQYCTNIYWYSLSDVLYAFNKRIDKTESREDNNSIDKFATNIEQNFDANKKDFEKQYSELCTAYNTVKKLSTIDGFNALENDFYNKFFSLYYPLYSMWILPAMLQQQIKKFCKMQRALVDAISITGTITATTLETLAKSVLIGASGGGPVGIIAGAIVGVALSAYSISNNIIKQQNSISDSEIKIAETINNNIKNSIRFNLEMGGVENLRFGNIPDLF